jgi:plastocyanin
LAALRGSADVAPERESAKRVSADSPPEENPVKIPFLFPVCCVAGMACYLGTSPDGVADNTTPDAKPVTVAMKSLSYDPMRLEIHVGDSVVWTNKSRTAHTATSDDDGKTFDTDEIEPGKSSKPVKFEKAGEFKYHCKVHGKSMSGSVVVKALDKK